MSPQPHMTLQRQAVLAVVQQADKHLTAQDVYDRVRKQLPGIAYATVYNALAYLHQARLIQVVDVGSGSALYDRNTGRHDHLVCRQCGKVLDYSLLDFNQTLEEVASVTQFKIEKAQVLFVGLCPDCQR